ncbi:methyltransferase domain-containing protein [Actinomadura geliboluensis]|uniref:Arsenite methyltransferase n=2 Tax=Actinomadura geliboluensis TaxID=882440 RepID=A0A5S4G7F3_9ACTN|nr:methyltransferase domain-containing protein [Actinomadura geliboluensis]TMR28351.1 methyltransferase domain-containing protein [Actinomadura geliboluensis]
MPDPSTGDPVEVIVARYSGLARLALAGGAPHDGAPCGDSCVDAVGYPSEDGMPEAALRASLGCGNPLAVAELRPGETVLDVGSGGGLDVLLSARRVGPGGTAYGLHVGDDMLTLARANAAQAGADNAHFLNGRIEDIPLPDAGVDVVISNCVINLAADKPRVLAEAFRVLRPGGRLGVSDIITEPGLDPAERTAAAQRRLGCAASTLTAEEYHRELRTAGFTAVDITTTTGTGGLNAAIVHAIKPD